MLFVIRYRDGEPEPLETETVREVLAPYAVAGAGAGTGPGTGPLDGVLIRTPEGHEVDVDVNPWCLGISRFPPGRFFDVLAELADRLRASVVPSDRPVVLRREEDRGHLPREARRDAVVVALTGLALARALTGP
ncbi:hypothetical protein ACIQUQ_20205 [Streptomyces sp. NPDC101118]|uniref:hypothetical protein n=1 Tax=Streptomyces sp. NPDC101118 TaxID=3366109 RepID=UPI0037F9D318